MGYVPFRAEWLRVRSRQGEKDAGGVGGRITGSGRAARRCRPRALHRRGLRSVVSVVVEEPREDDRRAVPRTSRASFTKVAVRQLFRFDALESTDVAKKPACAGLRFQPTDRSRALWNAREISAAPSCGVLLLYASRGPVRYAMLSSRSDKADRLDAFLVSVSLGPRLGGDR